MASFEQAKYCPNCKKNVGCDSAFRCTICGTKTQKGTWSVRDRDKRDPKKQVRKSGFKTEKEARLWYAKYLIDSENESAPVPAREIIKKRELTMKELYDEYIRISKSRIKESSLYDFESKSEKHILPDFGAMLVKSITAQIINEWQANLSSYAYRYRKELKSMLSRLFNYASRTYHIQSPMLDTEKIRDLDPKKKMLIWSPEEFKLFISQVGDDNAIFMLYFNFLYFSGCRKGEALALNFDDFDFVKNTVNICKSVTRKNRNKQWKITTPKNNGSYRIIDMPKTFMDALSEYRCHALSQGFRGPFVFGGDKPFADTTIIRIMRAAVEKANKKLKEEESKQELKIIRQHDLRHSHASLLISMGLPITMVSNRLGHANINETLKTYAHFLPQDKERMIGILNSISI